VRVVALIVNEAKIPLKEPVWTAPAYHEEIRSPVSVRVDGDVVFVDRLVCGLAPRVDQEDQATVAGGPAKHLTRQDLDPHVAHIHRLPGLPGVSDTPRVKVGGARVDAAVG